MPFSYDKMNEWMNELINFIILSPEGQAQGCIIQLLMVFNPSDNDSMEKDVAIIPLFLVWKLGVF